MRKNLHIVLAAALLAGSASAATAGELKLSMSGGRVTLIATDVPLRQILAEWSRIGQTKIVNAEKLMGPPLTLQLIDRPEREVLNVLLRSAAGYVAAPRAVPVAGLAQFDRIMILATSSAPAYSPTAAAPPPFTNRPNVAPTLPMTDDDPVEPNMMPPGVAPNMPQNVPQNMPIMNPGVATQPGVIPQPGMMPQPGQQQPVLTAPRPGMLPPPAPTPVNPYGPNQPIIRPGGPGGPGGTDR